jgi:hypothetical protein
MSSRAIDHRPGFNWTPAKLIDAIRERTSETETTPTVWMHCRDADRPNKWEQDWPRWSHGSAIYTPPRHLVESRR